MTLPSATVTVAGITSGMDDIAAIATEMACPIARTGVPATRPATEIALALAAGLTGRGEALKQPL
jgi:hypothetical protein